MKSSFETFWGRNRRGFITWMDLLCGFLTWSGPLDKTVCFDVRVPQFYVKVKPIVKVSGFKTVVKQLYNVHLPCENVSYFDFPRYDKELFPKTSILQV